MAQMPLQRAKRAHAVPNTEASRGRELHRKWRVEGEGQRRETQAVIVPT